MSRTPPPTMPMRRALAHLCVAVSRQGDVQAAVGAALAVLEWKRFHLAYGHMEVLVRSSPDMPRGYVLTDGTGNILVAYSNRQLLLAGPALSRVKRIGRLPRGCWSLAPLLMPELESALPR